MGRFYNIKVARGHRDGDQFIAWLNEKGHRAKESDNDANYVNGWPTSDHEVEDNIINALWNEYRRA